MHGSNSQGSRALFLGRAGSESWKVRADGGGYRYALCPKPKTYPTKRYMDLSESCFQETTLKFGIPDRHTFFVLLFGTVFPDGMFWRAVGDIQWIQSAE